MWSKGFIYIFKDAHAITKSQTPLSYGTELNSKTFRFSMKEYSVEGLKQRINNMKITKEQKLLDKLAGL